jgi:hypothetical protein
MTTMASQDVAERTGLVLQVTIDLLSDHVLHSRNTLTPEQVILLVQDVCIETRCIVPDLPRSVTNIYVEAHKRRDDPEHGRVDFDTSILIHDVEREVKDAV